MTLRLTMLCTSAAAVLLASQPALAGESASFQQAGDLASSRPGADIPGAQGVAMGSTGASALPTPTPTPMPMPMPMPAAPMMMPGAPAHILPVYSGHPHKVAAYPGGPAAMAPYTQYTHGAYPGTVPMAPAAYPPEYQQARADWVAECARRYRADRRSGNGGLIGGLLGAVVGGVIGNRVDNRGSRWGGTLLGAGAGGIAGAVVGSAIDRGSRRKHDDEALDWCEDYLAHASAQPYGAPMMMVPVMVPVRRCHTHEVVERVVEKPVYRTIPAPQKRVVAPVRAIKTQPAPVKSIKAGSGVK